MGLRVFSSIVIMTRISSANASKTRPIETEIKIPNQYEVLTDKKHPKTMSK